MTDWTKVSDGLPEPRESVIAWGILGSETEHAWHEAFVVRAQGGRFRWKSVRTDVLGDAEWMSLTSVTHWMKPERPAMSELLDSDVQILAAIANAQSAHAMMLASNNYSLASEGHPGNDPSYILGPAYVALYEEAERRGLIKKQEAQNE